MALPRFVSWVLQIAFIMPTAAYLFGIHFFDLASERIINGVLSFGIILMAFTPDSLFPLEYRWIKYAGKISFGIYIFHLFAIRLVFKCLTLASLSPDSFVFQVFLPFFSTVLAVAIAALSYETVEKYFLKMKNK
jgi:peptidoglycan/LPS O-acetylase OafA/YrhL